LKDSAEIRVKRKRECSQMYRPSSIDCPVDRRKKSGRPGRLTDWHACFCWRRSTDRLTVRQGRSMPGWPTGKSTSSARIPTSFL